MSEKVVFNVWCRKNCDSCGACGSKGELKVELLESDLRTTTLTCFEDETVELKIMGRSLSGKIGPRMKNTEVQKERKLRSSKHFQREILPTLPEGSDESNHFRKKYSKK